MSEHASPIVSLVNATPPTNAPRRVRVQLCTAKFGSAERVCTRVLHTNALLAPLLDTFSNAHWLDATIEVVPRIALKDCSLVFTVALHGSNRIPQEASDIFSLSSCRTFISGEQGTLPNVSSFSLEFDAFFISPLIKPAPLQMSQAAVSITSSIVSHDDDTTIDEDAPVYDVYVRGTISTGGSA